MKSCKQPHLPNSEVNLFNYFQYFWLRILCVWHIQGVIPLAQIVSLSVITSTSLSGSWKPETQHSASWIKDYTSALVTECYICISWFLLVIYKVSVVQNFLSIKPMNYYKYAGPRSPSLLRRWEDCPCQTIQSTIETSPGIWARNSNSIHDNLKHPRYSLSPSDKNNHKTNLKHIYYFWQW